jgi:hypothetical protein
MADISREIWAAYRKRRVVLAIGFIISPVVIAAVIFALHYLHAIEEGTVDDVMGWMASILVGIAVTSAFCMSDRHVKMGMLLKARKKVLDRHPDDA